MQLKNTILPALWFLAFIFTANLYAAEIYVALDGSDSNPGTIEKPFRTLEAAREHIRNLKTQDKCPAEGVTVYLRGGSYPVAGTFTLTKDDSGTEASPITYCSYPGERAILTGGKKVPNSIFKPITDPAIRKRIISEKARDKTLQADLKEIGISDYGQLQQAGFPRVEVPAPLELICNDRFMTLARWPNEETLRLGDIIEPGAAPRYKIESDKKPCFTYDYDRPEYWKQADNIWLYGIFNRTWAPDFNKVESIDTEKKQITLANAHHYGLKKYTPSWKWDWYYVMNLLEEIDQPGEWYLDRENGILYFWPPDDINSLDLQVTMLTAEYMVSLKNTSWVTFRDLTLEAGRENAISVNGGSNNLIDNCTLRNMGGCGADINGSGVFMGNASQVGTDKGGSNNGIKSCQIYGMGTLGVKLGGGDRKTLRPGGNFAVNNKIHHCGRRIQTYTPGVRLSGVANRVAQNEIHDMPQFGITFSGNEHIIELNNIHHVIQRFSDAGAIYTASNPSNRGTVIRHNFIHNIGLNNQACGVYIDYTNCGNTIEGNVFHGMPHHFGAVVINGGNDNIVRNNIFIDCENVLYASNFLNGWGKNEYDSYYNIWKNGLAEINYDQPPYSERYPKLINFFEEDHLNHDRNYFENNLIYNCKDIYNIKYDWEINKSNNFETAEDPGFVDAENMNFALKDDSVVYEKIPGFEKIPFEKIGIKKAAAEEKPVVYIVPNSHATIIGWLTDFNSERNYVLNNYLDHLDYLKRNPGYALAFSEVPNLMTMMRYEPKRLSEMKKFIVGGKVELVNAFFLEPTINLSGGEALVRMGLEGLRWQKEVMGFEPRFSWMIDVTGVHRQMPQIVSGLGLDGLVFARNNMADKNIFRWQSPDGSETLGLCIDLYCPYAWREFFKSEGPLSDEQLSKMIDETRQRIEHNPKNAPVLMPISGGDYGRAPVYEKQLEALMDKWPGAAPDIELRFGTASDFLAHLKRNIIEGKVELSVLSKDSAYSYDAFWISNPTAKKLFRQCEHELQSVEIISAIASLKSDFEYPSEDLYHAWLQLMLNMDRNALWGAGAGVAFQSPVSWDVQDRAESIRSISGEKIAQSLKKLTGKGEHLVIFNPLNWSRKDPIQLKLPANIRGKDFICESADNNLVLCQPELPAAGIKSFAVINEPVKKPARTADIPGNIKTSHYSIDIDPVHGRLLSVKLISTGREILKGPANEIIIETPKNPMNTGDLMVPRKLRKVLANSSDFIPEITVTKGEISTRINMVSEFYKNSTIKRTITLYRDYPRIDFDTELIDIPDNSLQVTAAFPLAEKIKTAKRGIPFGFSEWDPANPDPPLPYYQTYWDHQRFGYSEAIYPAVRWSAYEFEDGAGLAILDRGITGREIDNQAALLFLHNTNENYRGHPNPWLSGKGSNKFSYSIVAYRDWREVNIPRMAWEFNQPPLVAIQAGKTETASFLETSDNLILHSMRRESDFVEIRLAESMDRKGSAEVQVNLPHSRALITNMTGRVKEQLNADKRTYHFDVKPQEVITLRLAVNSEVPDIEPLKCWAPLIPRSKRTAFEKRVELKGHPPQNPN